MAMSSLAEDLRHAGRERLVLRGLALVAADEEIGLRVGVRVEDADQAVLASTSGWPGTRSVRTWCGSKMARNR